jgi:hypothetical protein
MLAREALVARANGHDKMITATDRQKASVRQEPPSPSPTATAHNPDARPPDDQPQQPATATPSSPPPPSLKREPTKEEIRQHVQSEWHGFTDPNGT